MPSLLNLCRSACCGLILAASAVSGQTARSIGPIVLTSADSSSSLSLQFAGQLRTQFQSKDKGEGKDRDDSFTTEARRVRLQATARLAPYHLDFKLHLSTAPGSLELMDLYFEYKQYPKAQVRVGQYKVPFTRYRIQSFQRLTFPDWAIVTKYYGAERQAGLALHNGYEKPPTWGYVAGVFTGVNARASHAVGLPGIYGEPVENPSDLADPGPKMEYHPEVFLHLSYNSPGIDLQSESDAKRGGFRYSTSVSGAWDFDPTPYEDLTARLAVEALMMYRGFSTGGIAYAGYADLGDQARTYNSFRGGLAECAYRLNRRYELSARYAIVDFADELVLDAQDHAAGIIADAQFSLLIDPDSEVAAAYLAEVTAQYGGVGRVTREEEITLGLNVYLDGHSLKMQNDLGWLRHHGQDDLRVDVVIRSQLQLAF